jgi:hypothetical protein
MSIIVYGPRGCGKTKHAEALRVHFNCAQIIDEAEWPKTSRDWTKFKSGSDLLLVTDDEKPTVGTELDRRVYSFEKAAADAGLDLRVHDAVNPSYYKDGGVECIDAIRAALGRDGFIAFLRGQVIKYSWRLGKKDAPLLEAQKAIWYQQQLVAELQKPVP